MLNTLMSYAYSYSTTGLSSSGADGIIAGFLALLGSMMIFLLALYIIGVIGMWKMFEKAGREGWKSLIPIYNMYVLTEISGQSGWLFLLCFIPGVGAIIWDIIVAIKLAPAFGKDTGFAIGLILLPFVFYLILGFGKDQYVLGRPAGAPAAGAAPQGPAPQGPAPAPQKPEDPWVSGQQ